MSELQEAIQEMRNMREIYNILANGTITAPVVGELESGKADIVAAINAMGGIASADMSLGDLANAIRDLILVQLGELEYNIQIENSEQALNLAQTNCTKFVDDYTTNMYTPLIVDEWQAVEEVRYKKLLNYNFDLFSSDERKTGVYALTLCHNLKKVVFDLLQTISMTYKPSQFIVSCIGLQEISMPHLRSVIVQSENVKILSDLPSLTNIMLPNLESVVVYSANSSTSHFLTDINTLTSLTLQNLQSIDVSAYHIGTQAYALTNMNSLRVVSLPNLTTITSTSVASGKTSILGGCPNIEYIEIGHIGSNGGSITKNMLLNINPTNIYEDATKLAALNAGIREHWFANLYDYTGGTAHTISLPTAFVQHMEQATKDVAAAKNWTIVTF